jgi:hypothetical protein
MAGTVVASRHRKDHMRLPVPLTALLGGALLLAGCSSSPEPAPAPAAQPSPSAAPLVELVLPATLTGLPRQTAAKWTKIAESRTAALERSVLGPAGDSVAGAYLDAEDISESVEVSAAAGRVADPVSTLRLLTGNLAVELADVRPAEVGTPGGVGTCGVSRKEKPAVQTVCHWAEPGSVGSVTFWSRKDRRTVFAEVKGLIQP